jgi:hypothetical protein
MTESDRSTDRHHGGPGSSHQNADKPRDDKERGPQPGEPTNPDRSRVSGGGGERDRHHTHDPATKS